MPRLHGREYVPGPAVPDGCKPSDEVFVVRASGEGVRTYEEYLERAALYRRRDWQNAVTGKGGFTYEEALRDEEKALAQLAKVRALVGGEAFGARGVAVFCVLSVLHAVVQTAGSGPTRSKSHTTAQ